MILYIIYCFEKKFVIIVSQIASAILLRGKENNEFSFIESSFVESARSGLSSEYTNVDMEKNVS